MKTTRTIKAVLLGVIAIALIGWLVGEFGTPPATPPKARARARRINIEHNVVTPSIAAPTSASVQGTGTPAVQQQR